MNAKQALSDFIPNDLVKAHDKLKEEYRKSSFGWRNSFERMHQRAMRSERRFATFISTMMLKFESGNDIPVDRIVVTRKEWEAMLNNNLHEIALDEKITAELRETHTQFDAHLSRIDQLEKALDQATQLLKYHNENDAVSELCEVINDRGIDAHLEYRGVASLQAIVTAANQCAKEVEIKSTRTKNGESIVSHYTKTVCTVEGLKAYAQHYAESLSPRLKDKTPDHYRDKVSLMAGACKRETYRDMFKRFSDKQRHNLANLFAHSFTIKSIEIESSFGGVEKFEAERPYTDFYINGSAVKEGSK